MFTSAKIKATRGNGADFYVQHLSNNDYYSEHDKIVGRWKGSLCETFGLDGKAVDEKEFLLFQQNLNPSDGSKLTQRNKSDAVRFFDFQCSAQKSVSIMSLFDERLIDAHREAVDLGMTELEKLASVRVRSGDDAGSKKCAFTGNIIYAQYHHDNSRMLDPQLHAHNVIVNVTKDADGKFRALEPLEMCRAIRYAGKSYQNAMARACVRLGYDIEYQRSDKGEITGFEIKGVPQEVIERCSKRREQIDKAIEGFVAQHGRQPTFQEINNLTILTRRRKMLEKTEEEVRDYKMSMFSDEEKHSFQALSRRAFSRGAIRLNHVSPELASSQLQKIVEQLFEREGVIQQDKLLAEVQNQNLGYTELPVLKEALMKLPGLVSLDSPQANPYITTE